MAVKVLGDSLIKNRIFTVSRCLLPNSVLIAKEKMITITEKPDRPHLSPVIKVNSPVTRQTYTCASQWDAPGRLSLCGLPAPNA